MAVGTFSTTDDDITIEITAIKALSNARIQMAESSSLAGSYISLDKYLDMLRAAWSPPTPLRGDFSFRQRNSVNGTIHVFATMTLDASPSTRRFVDTLRICWSPENGLISITFTSPGFPNKVRQMTSLDDHILCRAQRVAREWGMLCAFEVSYMSRRVKATDSMRTLNEFGATNGAVFTITAIKTVKEEPVEVDNDEPIEAGMSDRGAGPAEQVDQAEPEAEQELD